MAEFYELISERSLKTKIILHRDRSRLTVRGDTAMFELKTINYNDSNNNNWSLIYTAKMNILYSVVLYAKSSQKMI